MSHVAACRHSRTARLAAFAILASPLSLAAQGASPSSPSVGSIGGLVVDSLLGGGPLAHVEVWIDGTTRTARTDRAGRFRFDAVPAGRHRLAFVHPTLDAQRIGTPTATVDVTAGMHAEARLVTPSASAVHAARCPPGAEARTGLLLGLVSPPDAAGIAADVVVSWSVLTIARGRVQAVPRELTVRSGDDGAFRLCGVPIDLPVQLRAQGADGALAVAEVAFDGRATALARVPLPHALAPEPTVKGGVAEALARGATVRGIVRSAHGAAVAGAVVAVAESPSVAPVVTREDGSFVLAEVPGGARVLEARAIGYRPVRARLTLDAGRVTRVVLALGDDATVLATTRVTASRRSAMVDDYERRLAAGTGRFVTRADIERRRALTTTELIALVRGVRIVPPSQAFNAPQIAFGRTLTGPLTSAACRPLVYVDGVRAMSPLDAQVRKQELYGIEVHASAATIPPQFAGPDAGRGVVLLWTRRAGDRRGQRRPRGSGSRCICRGRAPLIALRALHVAGPVRVSVARTALHDHAVIFGGSPYEFRGELLRAGFRPDVYVWSERSSRSRADPRRRGQRRGRRPSVCIRRGGPGAMPHRCRPVVPGPDARRIADAVHSPCSPERRDGRVCSHDAAHNPIMHRTLIRTLFAGAAFAAVPAAVQAQAAVTVSGQVTVEGGQPLSAAQVFIPAFNVGASTRDDGRYTLTLPARSVGQTVTITARRIGYQSQSRQLAVTGPSLTANFTLTQAAAQLTGVVVTALGIEREKSTLGTAQQQVTSTELTQTKAQNLVNQLQGKVSGVQITGAGTPGGSTNIIIRGQNSLAGNNQPLFVVDGIPVSNANRGGTLGNGYDYGNAISDLNPDDIESLTILKGPNAAALYGSRASNGVVVITTKKGMATDGRMRTEFNSFLQFDRPSILPEWQNQYGQGAGGAFRFVNGAGRGTCDGCDQSWGPKLDGRPIDQFTGTQQPWVAHPDNVNEFFETGRTFSSTLAVSGGSERANARLSLGTDQIKGFVPNNSFRKVSSLLSGNLQVNPKLSTTATLQYIRNAGINRVGTGYSNSILEQFFWFGRQVDMSALEDYAQSGRANGGPTTREYNWNYNYHNNPYWIQYENPRRDNRDRFQGSVSATYQLADGVNLLARTGSDIYRLEGNQNYAPGYINGTYVNQSYQGGFLSFDEYRNENNTDLILTADRELTGRLRINGTLGGNLRREEFSEKSQQTTGLLVAGTYNISNTAVDPTLVQRVTRRQVNGVYGSAAFTWNDWWTLEGTARNDWSSTLPKGENSYFYPSVNTSIILTDAIPALRENRWLSFAKLRGGVAEVGADANPYQLATTFTGNSVKFGTLPQYSLGNVLANAQLKPEITRSNEIGVELGLLNGRVTFDGTIYDRYTRNQIFEVTVSPASGFTNKAINAGRLSNKGVEALISVIPVRQQGGLTWTTTFNYGRNRNRVDELTDGVSSITLSQGLFGDIAVENRVGEPAGVIRTYPIARDEQGRIITADGLPVHGDTLASFGNTQADWIGGWNNTFQYKGFTLNALLDIRRGGKIVSYTNYIGDYSGVLQSSLKGREVDFDNPGLVVQGVNEDGTPNTTNVSAETYYQSLFGSLEYYIYDASYTRLREVRVGFDLPSRLASRLNAQSVSLALTGRNLLLWKNIPNVDPEFAYNTGNFQGVEYALPSNPRSIGVSVRITP